MTFRATTFLAVVFACAHCSTGESASATMPDASQPETQKGSSNDAGDGTAADTGVDTGPSSDAQACPTTGIMGLAGLESTTLGQQIVYECSHRWDALGGLGNVWVSTNECGGFLGLLVQNGIDTQTLYLFDPVTMVGVERASGANGQNDCAASATGSPQATSCTFAVAYGPIPSPQPGSFAWRDACTGDGGMADAGDASESVDGAPDVSTDR
jgi:hypothetical protein